MQFSTGEVYGSIDEGSWTETSPLSPNSPYSASKAGSDLLALAYHRTHGLDVVVTRCSNNYGPYQFPRSVPAHQRWAAAGAATLADWRSALAQALAPSASRMANEASRLSQSARPWVHGKYRMPVFCQ